MNPADLRALIAPEYIRRVIIQTYETMFGAIGQLKHDAFRQMPGQRKPLSVLDLLVEKCFAALVTSRYPNIDVIRTEDVVADFSLEHYGRTCMLIDILDGAHMQQRRLSNWCSAITIFDRHIPRIHGAYVIVPSTECIYYATEFNPNAFIIEMPGLARIDARTPFGSPTELRLDIHPSGRGWNRIPTSVSSEGRSLDQATVCMYSQRCRHLAAVTAPSRYTRLLDWLRELAARDENLSRNGLREVEFRFYNLGGNPMLARLCDGGVDMVMDLSGALPNDWVAGAYIARKAGAHLGRPDGTEIIESDLAEALLAPATSRVPYIAAADEQLFREMVDVLR